MTLFPLILQEKYFNHAVELNAYIYFCSIAQYDEIRKYWYIPYTKRGELIAYLALNLNCFSYISKLKAFSRAGLMMRDSVHERFIFVSQEEENAFFSLPITTEELRTVSNFKNQAAVKIYLYLRSKPENYTFSKKQLSKEILHFSNYYVFLEHFQESIDIIESNTNWKFITEDGENYRISQE